MNMSNVGGGAYFVAEVSSNHQRSLARCLQFVDVAAEVGCDAVKFQLFRIDELFSPEILAGSEEHRRRRDWELPLEFVPRIVQRCSERDIDFSCTPFYLDAVDFLEPYVSFYKVASYELLWHELLRRCAGTGKPIVLSTGMANLDEIRAAVHACETGFRGCDGRCEPSLTLLHCVSGYPTPLDDCNLAAIETLRSTLCGDGHELAIGWSDHSVRAEVIERAIERWSAELIEFHLDLDGRGEEYEAGHCWLPEQIAPVIEWARSRDRLRWIEDETATRVDGDGLKAPRDSELDDRLWRADPSDGLRPLREIRRQYRSMP